MTAREARRGTENFAMENKREKIRFIVLRCSIHPFVVCLLSIMVNIFLLSEELIPYRSLKLQTIVYIVPAEETSDGKHTGISDLHKIECNCTEMCASGIFQFQIWLLNLYVNKSFSYDIKSYLILLIHNVMQIESLI